MGDMASMPVVSLGRPGATLALLLLSFRMLNSMASEWDLREGANVAALMCYLLSGNVHLRWD